jgi:hypothetical protein
MSSDPVTSALRPELDGQDPFSICGGLCPTRKTPTLAFRLSVVDAIFTDSNDK